MAFVRPAILVYQEFQTVTVAPDTPDLNCCLVGPAFYIQDYPTDKTSILAGNFVKTGFTADAPCLADGTSAGKPDNGTDFLTLSNPPNHTAGGVLDAASVALVFDDVYLDLNHGIDGAVFAEGDNKFTSASASFITKKIAAGDRLIMTKSINPGETSFTVVKMVKEVVDPNTIRTTTTFKSTDTTKIGSSSVLWRVEHKLDDQTIGSAYRTIVGNAITIKTGSTGIQLTYESASFAVNYAQMYIGYRELRTNLQDVKSITGPDDITSVIGRVDERNPLAAGLQVAMANTGTPIQAFGVVSDDLSGHTSARDKMSSRNDIYAIVPLTDPATGVSGADWVSVIGMWKAHCVAYEDADRSKFRVVLGSYDELPTEKSSAPPSTTGFTLPGNPSTDPYDVFVDPNAETKFVTNGVSSDHVLDVARASDAALNTVGSGLHIFSPGYFTDGVPHSKGLLGAIGEKRLRTTIADKWIAGGHAAERCCYAVREAVLRSEGGTPKAALVTVAIDEGADGDTGKVKLTKASGFIGVVVGDVVHVQNASVSGYNGGWLVRTKTDDSNIVLQLAYTGASDPATYVDVYAPATSLSGATASTSPNAITATGKFANVAAGDILYVLHDAVGGNEGMWIITAVISANEVRVSGGTDNLTSSVAVTDFAVFSVAAESNGSTLATVRQRLTRLRDDSASFLTTVEAGEDIEIPYPSVTDPTLWDTTTTQWKIDTIVADELLDADLDDLEELAPYQFTTGFSGPSHYCSYRINIDLNSDAQVTELNTITTSLANHRCVMVWPNQCYVSDLQNELTGVQNKQPGQYLACMVGGMVAGLPSHQGFSYLGGTGIQQIFNSNFYFSDTQLTNLRNGGWYVIVQDSETSLPYTIHEVTTDVSAYAFGEFMNVKNYDFCSLYLKEILMQFPGRYNIYADTLNMIKGSLEGGIQYLKLRIFPKIGTPLLDATVISVAQLESEEDRVEAYVELSLPKVLNRIGLHLRS